MRPTSLLLVAPLFFLSACTIKGDPADDGGTTEATGATDGHIRRYTGDISPQAARELNALLEHMKLECGYYAIDLPAPKDGRWKAALLQQLPLFMAATLLLNATPGVDLLLTVTRTAQGGARAGAMAALGIAAGCAVHALAAAFGLDQMAAMAMKRDVLRLGGYACEFFVSQTPELTEMADRIIDLEGMTAQGAEAVA